MERFLLLGAGGLLLLFAGKAIHLDEPVYLQVAQRVLDAPLDFHGFELNWTGVREPLFRENMNPPGVAFFLAAAGSLLGFSEVALHAAMLLPALAVAAGTWRLARRLCGSPRTAALAALATPAFAVSATTLMADVLALALWVWACVLFVEGLDRGRRGPLLAAGLLGALCFLTKFAGLALVPLLCVYGLARRGRPGAWSAALALPVAAAGLYELHAALLYGEPALWRAAGYAGEARGGPGWVERGAIGCLFLGGGYLSSLLLMPLLWRGRALLGWALAAAALALCLAWRGALGPVSFDAPFPGAAAPGAGPGIALQGALFGVAGLQLLWLALRELGGGGPGRRPLGERRRPEAWLLGPWVLGVFVFASWLNWTVSVRALLPAAPAVGILLARALERRRACGGAEPAPAAAGLLALGLVVSLAVAWGDHAFAAAARVAARELVGRYAAPSRTVWFQGAWGFQHYALAAGARKVDRERSVLRPGDVLIVPRNNTDAGPLPPPALAEPLERARFPASRWVATISPALGAGFYSARWGPLPFAFGANPPEPYDVFEVRAPVSLRETPGP